MAKRFKLPNKGWGDPLRKLTENVRKYPQGEKEQSLSFAVSDCSRYYGYLKGIWRRLMRDFELYDTYWSMMEKYIGKVEGRLELSSQSLCIIKKRRGRIEVPIKNPLISTL